MYRLYDYAMYVSNILKDVDKPPIHSSERYGITPHLHHKQTPVQATSKILLKLQKKIDILNKYKEYPKRSKKYNLLKRQSDIIREISNTKIKLLQFEFMGDWQLKEFKMKRKISHLRREFNRIQLELNKK